MTEKKSNQGKYHLLAIFLLPAVLVSIFLSDNWIVPLVVIALAGAIAYAVLRV